MRNILKGLSKNKREEIANVIKHDGPQLRKVDRKYKSGDFVRFSGGHARDITHGTFYEIYNNGWFSDDQGGSRFVRSTALVNDMDYEIFEVAGNKMVSLNEIASLVQLIQSHMDDSENDVLVVDIDTCHSHVQMKHIAFLIEFINYEVEFKEDKQFPYEVSKVLNGVKFVAYMNAADIVDLKTAIPDQWEYIQSKVQVEAV